MKLTINTHFHTAIRYISSSLRTMVLLSITDTLLLSLSYVSWSVQVFMGHTPLPDSLSWPLTCNVLHDQKSVLPWSFAWQKSGEMEKIYSMGNLWKAFYILRRILTSDSNWVRRKRHLLVTYSVVRRVPPTPPPTPPIPSPNIQPILSSPEYPNQ